MPRRGNKGEIEEGKDSSRASWSRESLLILCDLCLEHVDVSKGKSGSKTSQRIKWKALEEAFKKKTGLVYGGNQLKNKYDWMRNRWSLWKQLKGRGTGLGWDHDKKTISASDEWWEKKIKENPKFEGFKDEGLDPELEYKMDQLFEASVAMGDKKYTPAIDLPSSVDDVQREVEEGYTPSPPYYDNTPDPLLGCCDYVDESGGSYNGCQSSAWRQVWGEPSPLSSPSPTPIDTQNEMNARNKGKRAAERDILQSSKRAKSGKTDCTASRKGGVAMVTELIVDIMQTIKHRNTEIANLAARTAAPTSNVGDALALVMQMSGLMSNAESTFACLMIEDVTKREIFLGLPTDEARMEYIKLHFELFKKNG